MLGIRYGPAETRFLWFKGPNFSDSRDPIFNSRVPNRIPKAPQKYPGLSCYWILSLA